MECLEAIKSSAEEVMENLGPSYGYFKEADYEEAIMHEFRLREIPYERQRNIEIIYKGYCIGMRTPDCILYPSWCGNEEDEFLLEMKAIAKTDKKQTRQAQVYLASMNIDKGAVLNFNSKTNSIDIEEVEKPDRIQKKEIATPSDKPSNKDVLKVLQAAGKDVLDYLGTEFFYHEKGRDIYVKAVGIELMLNGLQFHAASHPILYKGHRIKEYDYDYIFPNGEAAKIIVYKKEEEIDSQAAELNSFNRRFGIRKGFILAVPEKEDMEVAVKKV